MAHTQKSAARAVKRDFAQCLAKGNHLAAANDEPEPSFADIEAECQEEARRIVADRAEPSAAQKVAREYERALTAQVERQGAAR